MAILWMVFAMSAVVGGTVMLCQFGMSLLGLSHMVDDLDGHDLGHDAGHDLGEHDGADHDGDAHADHVHGSNWFFGVITFRTVVAALTFFGLGGMAAAASERTALESLLLALGAGGAAMYTVHWILLGMANLRLDGTARIEHAVGCSGTVYLRIPGARTGTGKVTVTQGPRSIEYLAVTGHGPLATGAKIVVTRIVSADTVEVEAVPVAQEPTHV